MSRLVYSPSYFADLGAHVMPIRKFGLVADALAGAGHRIDPPERAEDLKAGDVGVDHLGAGGLAARRNRQQRRHDHRAGVGIGRVVGVVVVQRMSDGAVVKGGVALGSVATRANQKGRCL